MAPPMPPAPPVTRATRPSRLFGLRQELQLALLEDPVLDAEGLLLGDRSVGVDALRPSHHVDGLDVVLGGVAGGGLVAMEGQHAQAGDEHEHRVGIAHRGRVGPLAPLVVGLVVLPVLLDEAGKAGRGGPRPFSFAGSKGTKRGLTLVRRKWSGQVVPRSASSAQRARPTKSSTSAVSTWCMTFVTWAERRPRRTGATSTSRARRSSSGSGCHDQRPEGLGPALAVEPVGRLLDDAQRRLVGLLRRLAPGHEAVAAEDEALERRVLGRHLPDLEAEIEARALPGHPADPSAEALAGQPLAVSGPPRSR